MQAYTFNYSLCSTVPQLSVSIVPNSMVLNSYAPSGDLALQHIVSYVIDFSVPSCGKKNKTIFFLKNS